MLTYTDAKVRAAIEAWMRDEVMSYRTAAALMGIDSSALYRMAKNTYPISERVARFVGFAPISDPKRWIKLQTRYRKTGA